MVSQAGFASIAFGWESFDRTVRRRDAGSLPYSSRVEIEASIGGVWVQWGSGETLHLYSLIGYVWY